ncbi:MAG: MFS transporter [Acidobacteria bacterium]|nr:MFS transporter [Acidobacteriota bacterium]
MRRAVTFVSLHCRWPPVVWVVIGGMFVMRTAFFMAWPFLAIILSRDFGMSPSGIGALLGGAFLVSALAGLWAGNLGDQFGPVRLMLAGCGLAAAGYGLLATGADVAAIAAGALLVGLSRAALEAPGKAIIADCLADRAQRDLAFHLRYFAINLGGAIGPLLGIVFGLTARQTTFWVTAATHATFAAVVAAVAVPAHAAAAPGARESRTFRAAARVLRGDRPFQLLVLAMFLTMAAYAQLESTLIQYVSGHDGAVGARLVTALLMTNTITIVLFQFPLLRLLSPYRVEARIHVGLALFVAGFIAYALLPVRGVVPWIVATWVLSVGEAILFPTLQLHVDRIAPSHLKGSYYGAAGLSAMGFGLGPLVGGVLLEHAGGSVTFSVTAAATAVCGVCYRLADRLRR